MGECFTLHEPQIPSSSRASSPFPFMEDFLFSGLPSHTYTFQLKALDTIHLPEFKGSTFRGSFGHAFKKVVCTFGQKACDDCLLHHTCAYSYIFETTPPAAADRMRKYLRAPHPFIIEPPLEKKRQYLAGETLRFDLVLVGRGNLYLPYFVYAFQEVGNVGIGSGKGKFSLQSIALGDRLIYEGDTGVLLPVAEPVVSGDADSDLTATCVDLQFVSPTRLQLGTRLVHQPTFQDIFRILVRRISMLSYFHCGGDLDLDFRGLIERSAAIQSENSRIEWWDWERYSARQDKRIMMGGFVGAITYRGGLGEFLPFLRAGELLHLGKGTVFGMGKYLLGEVS